MFSSPPSLGRGLSWTLARLWSCRLGRGRVRALVAWPGGGLGRIVMIGSPRSRVVSATVALLGRRRSGGIAALVAWRGGISALVRGRSWAGGRGGAHWRGGGGTSRGGQRSGDRYGAGWDGHPAVRGRRRVRAGRHVGHRLVLRLVFLVLVLPALLLVPWLAGRGGAR